MDLDLDGLGIPLKREEARQDGAWNSISTVYAGLEFDPNQPIQESIIGTDGQPYNPFPPPEQYAYGNDYYNNGQYNSSPAHDIHHGSGPPVPPYFSPHHSSPHHQQNSQDGFYSPQPPPFVPTFSGIPSHTPERLPNSEPLIVTSPSYVAATSQTYSTSPYSIPPTHYSQQQTMSPTYAPLNSHNPISFTPPHQPYPQSYSSSPTQNFNYQYQPPHPSSPTGTPLHGNNTGGNYSQSDINNSPTSSMSNGYSQYPQYTQLAPPPSSSTPAGSLSLNGDVEKVVKVKKGRGPNKKNKDRPKFELEPIPMADPNKVKCPQCEKILSKGSFPSHKMIHSGEKPHKCEDCDRFFRQMFQLRLHRSRKHTVGKDHKCEICSMCFKLGDALKRHLLTHNEPIVAHCKICKAPFNNKRSATLHQKEVHSRRENAENVKGIPISDPSVKVKLSREEKRIRLLRKVEEDERVKKDKIIGLKAECLGRSVKVLIERIPQDQFDKLLIRAKELQIELENSLEKAKEVKETAANLSCKHCGDSFSATYQLLDHLKIHRKGEEKTNNEEEEPESQDESFNETSKDQSVKIGISLNLPSPNEIVIEEGKPAKLSIEPKSKSILHELNKKKPNVCNIHSNLKEKVETPIKKSSQLSNKLNSNFPQSDKTNMSSTMSPDSVNSVDVPINSRGIRRAAMENKLVKTKPLRFKPPEVPELEAAPKAQISKKSTTPKLMPLFEASLKSSVQKDIAKGRSTFKIVPIESPDHRRRDRRNKQLEKKYLPGPASQKRKVIEEITIDSSESEGEPTPKKVVKKPPSNPSKVQSIPLKSQSVKTVNVKLIDTAKKPVIKLSRMTSDIMKNLVKKRLGVNTESNVEDLKETSEESVEEEGGEEKSPLRRSGRNSIQLSANIPLKSKKNNKGKKSKTRKEPTNESQQEKESLEIDSQSEISEKVFQTEKSEKQFQSGKESQSETDSEIMVRQIRIINIEEEIPNPPSNESIMSLNSELKEFEEKEITITTVRSLKEDKESDLIHFPVDSRPASPSLIKEEDFLSMKEVDKEEPKEITESTNETNIEEIEIKAEMKQELNSSTELNDNLTEEDEADEEIKKETNEEDKNPQIKIEANEIKEQIEINSKVKVSLTPVKINLEKLDEATLKAQMVINNNWREKVRKEKQKRKKNLIPFSKQQQENEAKVKEMMKKMQCSYCFRTFDLPQALKNHLKCIHKEFGFFAVSNQYKEVECKTCGKFFSQASSLARHNTVSHLKILEKCKFCKWSFNTFYMKTHVKIVHEREKPFMCQFCGKMFALSNYLNIHLAQNHSKQFENENELLVYKIINPVRKFRKPRRKFVEPPTPPPEPEPEPDPEPETEPAKTEEQSELNQENDSTTRRRRPRRSAIEMLMEKPKIKTGGRGSQGRRLGRPRKYPRPLSPSSNEEGKKVTRRKKDVFSSSEEEVIKKKGRPRGRPPKNPRTSEGEEDKKKVTRRRRKKTPVDSEDEEEKDEEKKEKIEKDEKEKKGKYMHHLTRMKLERPEEFKAMWKRRNETRLARIKREREIRVEAVKKRYEMMKERDEKIEARIKALENDEEASSDEEGGGKRISIDEKMRMKEAIDVMEGKDPNDLGSKFIMPDDGDSSKNYEIRRQSCREKTQKRSVNYANSWYTRRRFYATTTPESPKEIMGKGTEKTDEERIKCRFCYRKFLTDAEASAHLDYHKDDKFNCPACGHKFSHKHRLKTHFGRVHKTIKMPEFLNIHGATEEDDVVRFKIFEGEKVARVPKLKYKCKSCEAMFSNIHKFKAHEFIHKKTSYGCTRCPYKAFLPIMVKKHITHAHGGQGSVKRFKTKGPAKEKEGEEEKKENEVENEAGEEIVFGNSEEIEIYKKIMSSEDNVRYNCDECTASYNNTFNITRHMFRHHGVTVSFKQICRCKNCGVTFKQRKHLFLHVISKICTKGREVDPFLCEKPGCNHVAKHVVDYRKHIEEAHEEIPKMVLRPNDGFLQCFKKTLTIDVHKIEVLRH